MRRYTIQQNSVGNIFFTDLDNEDGSFNLPFGVTPVKKKSKDILKFQDIRGNTYIEFLASEIESVTDKNGTITLIWGNLDLLYETLTGTFFFKLGFASSAGGYPVVNTRNDLPTDIIEAPIESIYLVSQPVTNIFTNGNVYKSWVAGLYHRDTITGSLNDWRAIPYKISFTDLEFKLVNDLAPGKQSMEDLSLITDGETRTYTRPDKSGTYALLDDTITDTERLAISDNTSTIIAEATTRANADLALGVRIDDEETIRQNIDEGTVNIHSDVDLFDSVVPKNGWMAKNIDGLLTYSMLEHAFYNGDPVINTVANTPLASTPLFWEFDFQRVGDYMVGVSFFHSYGATNSSNIAVLTLNGNTLATIADGEILRKEAKEAGGNDGDGRGTSQKEPGGMVYFPVTITAIGTQELRLENFPQTNGVESSIWDVTIVIEEIFNPQIKN